MTVQQAFGIAVRAVRISKDMSQEQLALESGLDRTYVSGIERGVRNISLASIYKVTVALNISLGELFNEVEKYMK